MKKISYEIERVKLRLFLKPFAYGWRRKIPHCTAVSCPWGVKPKLEVVFQLMAGSGSISHKWDYPQCNSVQGKFPLHFTSIPFTGLHSWLWKMMVSSWLWTLGHLYKSSALGDPSPPLMVKLLFSSLIKPQQHKSRMKTTKIQYSCELSMLVSDKLFLKPKEGNFDLKQLVGEVWTELWWKFWPPHTRCLWDSTSSHSSMPEHQWEGGKKLNKGSI